MESLIIIILIAVASSIIQSVSQSNKQKRAVANPQAIVPKPKQNVKLASKPNNSTTGRPKQVGGANQNLMGNTNMDNQAANYYEGMQIEASVDVLEPEKRNERTNRESIEIVQDIGFDDLQRSIIMTEILGKPKALKKSVR